MNYNLEKSFSKSIQISIKHNYAKHSQNWAIAIMETNVDLHTAENNLSVYQLVSISGKENVMDFGEEDIVFTVFVVNLAMLKYNGKMKLY